MALDILVLSPTYKTSAEKQTRERNALLVQFLTDEYEYPSGGIPEAKRLMIENGYSEPLSESMVDDGQKMYRRIYVYYNNPRDREKIDKFLRDEQAKPQKRYRQYIGIYCFLKDNPEITTWQEVVAKTQAFADSEDGAAPDAHHRALPAPASAMPEDEHITAQRSDQTPRPFQILAGAIDGIVDVETEQYEAMENIKEEVEELKRFRIQATRDIRLLRERLADQEDRLVQLKEILTMDPDGLAATRKGVERLVREVIVNKLPTHVQVGEYWKDNYSIVYRREFTKFLKDKGTQPQERDSVVDGVKHIAANLFYGPLETEVRRNGEENVTVSGINPGETYYYCHPDPWLRIRLVIRPQERRVHFIDAVRKKEIAA